MGSDEISVKQEALAVDLWSTPPSLNVSRTLPKTLHESHFPYYISEDYSSFSDWNSSTMSIQPLHENLHPQTYDIRQNSCIENVTTPGQRKSLLSNGDQTSLESSNAGSSLVGWNSKTCDDGIELHEFDTQVNLGRLTQEYIINESSPIVDLGYSESCMESDGFRLGQSYNDNRRRMSSSSFTVSTSGPLLDMQRSYEDFSTTLSDTTSFSSPDNLPLSNRNSLMSSIQLSPVASPRMTPQHRTDIMWSQSCGRATPSPRATIRSAPYSVDSVRNKRWSTGSYAPTSNRRPSQFIYQQNSGHDISNSSQTHQISSRHSSPTLPNMQNSIKVSDFSKQQQQQQQPLPPPPPHHFFQSQISNSYGGKSNFHHITNTLVPSQNYDDPSQFENPVATPLMSDGIFRMLQSNVDIHALHNHFTYFSDPPDLYTSLHEEHIPPPPEDMNPTDSDLIPHEQELRFDGDLYTPRWVRGHGNKREGWCGICKPGRWLILKNSAFWYDKSFTHGISAATGSPFREPQETRRMDGNPDVWEGLCGSCNEWVALVSSKKKGTTWFRHAYKCHTHPKIKDAPKRRRENLHNRAIGASKVAKSNIEASPPTSQNPKIPTVEVIQPAVRV